MKSHFWRAASCVASFLVSETQSSIYFKMNCNMQHELQINCRTTFNTELIGVQG